MLVKPNQTAGILDRYSFTRAEADQNVLAVDQTGRRFHGAAAANRALLELGPFWRRIGSLYWVGPIGWIEERLYRWVARNRSWLAELVRTRPELPDG